MKVSYIIIPFENAEYLIRCVNSLYRQLGEDYEVIFAENELDENSIEFLNEKPRVKRISGSPQTVEEKLLEAAELISGDSDYVQLIDVNTVVSPICTKAIIACEKSDLIVPAAAIKKGDGFVADAPKLPALEKKYDKYSPQRFCFGRGLFERFLDEVVENEELFPLFLLSVFVENRAVNFIDDVCMYADEFAPTAYSDDDLKTVKARCTAFFDILPKINNPEVQVEVIGQYMANVSKFLADEDLEIRRNAFYVLHDICENIQDNFLFKRYFESKIGFEAEDFMRLNYEEYTVYKTSIPGIKNSVTPVDNAAQNKLLKDMKDALDSTKKELSELKKNISEIKAKPMIIPAPQGTALKDPSVDVPQMYRDGKLGLKTIWRSFCGWLKYKFGGKK